MKINNSLIFVIILILAACSEEENAQVRNWEILALEKQVIELNIQNQELSLILNKMNSNHVSIRLHTKELINDLEEVKIKIIDFANDEYEPEIKVYDQRISTKGRIYPRTFTFKHPQIPKRLTRLVIRTLDSFDKLQGLDSNTLITFLEEMDRDHPNAIQEEELFDGLNLGQTVQLLELVQIRILMDENKYLTKQFDHAINRMVVFQNASMRN